MEQSSSWEPKKFSASQAIPRVLETLDVSTVLTRAPHTSIQAP